MQSKKIIKHELDGFIVKLSTDINRLPNENSIFELYLI